MKIITKKQANLIAKNMGLPAGPLSFSQIGSSYLLCPNLYKLKYIDKIKIEKLNVKLIFGSVIHAGLETIMNMKKEQKEIDFIYVARAIRNVLSSRIRTYDISLVEERQFKIMISQSEELLRLFIKKYLKPIVPSGVEETFYAMLGDVPVVVKIDLIDNNKKVIDFKVTGQMKSENTANNSLQLGMYSAVTEIRKTGFISFKMPDYKKAAKWEAKIKPVDSRKKTSDLEWCEEVIWAVYKNIKAGSFNYCNPENWNCSEKYCDYWNICRGKSNSSSVPIKTQSFTGK